ncbi:MAG: carbohydrate ABC transporter permease [Clostridia bacterium]|nr:carbohydrate ABC transporter permease [Clostridia bacterium]
MKKIKFNYKFFIYLFFFLFSLCFILPFLLLIGISFSTEQDLINAGFKIIPENFTTYAYDTLFREPTDLITSYIVTAIYAFVPTTFGIFFEACCGYALSKEDFVYKKPLKIFLLITMFFSGGLVPTYILRTQYLGLQDNMWVYVITFGINAMEIFIFRTFFAQLPKELSESAYLDGATEMNILIKIVAPLSKSVIATYFLFGVLNKWNDYQTTLYYITDKKLYTLQYLLQGILQEAEQIKKMIMQMGLNIEEPPTETLKFAICVMATFPMLVLFPFFQRFFSKGVMVGSVKG